VCDRVVLLDGDAVAREEVAGALDLDWTPDDPYPAVLCEDRQREPLFEFLPDALDGTLRQEDFRAVTESGRGGHTPFI